MPHRLSGIGRLIIMQGTATAASLTGYCRLAAENGIAKVQQLPSTLLHYARR